MISRSQRRGSAVYCSLSSAGGRESLRKPPVFYGFMRTGENQVPEGRNGTRLPKPAPAAALSADGRPDRRRGLTPAIGGREGLRPPLGPPSSTSWPGRK